MPLALPRRRSPPSPVNLHESESNRAYSEHQNEERSNGGKGNRGYRVGELVFIYYNCSFDFRSEVWTNSRCQYWRKDARGAAAARHCRSRFPPPCIPRDVSNVIAWEEREEVKGV